MKIHEKEILRFALADHAFREADALAQHIIDSNIPAESHIFSGAVCGVVTCYCRPFMSSEGLGPLHPSMSDFGNSALEQSLLATHEAIFAARHKTAAHFDRTFASERHRAGELPLPPSKVTFDLQPNGFAVSTNATYLSPQRLALARDLFAFQLARVAARLGLFAVELVKQHKRTGEFVFDIK